MKEQDEVTMIMKHIPQGTGYNTSTSVNTTKHMHGTAAFPTNLHNSLEQQSNHD